MRGNIHSPYAGRAKEYAWSFCMEYAPRKITPSDIDYMVESNEHFLFFEMKTEGAEMPKGQRIALERLVKAVGGKAVLMVVKHPPIPVVEMPLDITGVELWTLNNRGQIQVERRVPWYWFGDLYAAFFSWAEGDRTAFDKVVATALKQEVAA